jgi:hypothetical protein
MEEEEPPPVIEAEEAPAIQEGSIDSADGSNAIADVADLKFVEKRNVYVLKVDSCDRRYTFRLKDWGTKEAIAKVASEIRSEIIKSQVDYSMKTVAQLREILREQKKPTNGRKEALLNRLVLLSAPECPTPPTAPTPTTAPMPPASLNKEIELSTEFQLPGAQPEPAAFVVDEKPNQIDVTDKLFNFHDEEEDIDDFTASAKYKLPAAILKCFRNYSSREQHTGKRFRAYLLGKVDSHETMQIETVFIPKQDGFDDVQKNGNSRYLWPEDRVCVLLKCYVYIYIYIHIYNIHRYIHIWTSTQVIYIYIFLHVCILI